MFCLPRILVVVLSFFVSVALCASGENAPGGIQLQSNSNAILKVFETEVWDTKSHSWKATRGDQRWTDDKGEASLAPTEVRPPEGHVFDGDWKIVLHGGDSMGWEYSFQYLQPPTRRRVWLRSLAKALPQPYVPTKTKKFSRTLARIRDAYNFKGFNLYFYKSLLTMESFGMGIGLPLTMNFEMWDRNPGLPSISSSLGLYFPWTIATILSTSVRIEWLRWFLMSVLLIVPRIAVFVAYRLVLPAVWAVATTILLPLQIRLPPPPEGPKIHVQAPQYNPEISERVGCSVSYRWSQLHGFEFRCNFWHSYLPTVAIYRKILRMKTPLDWWQKHFGSLGLSSSYPLPYPPHFSCSACLGLNGLYFRSKTAATKAIPKSEEEASTPKSPTAGVLREHIKSPHRVTESPQQNFKQGASLKQKSSLVVS